MEPSALSDERNFGYSAAHEAVPLPLLPSGPGGVCGESSHRARSSADCRASLLRDLRAAFFARLRESNTPFYAAKVLAVPRVFWRLVPANQQIEKNT